MIPENNDSWFARLTGPGGYTYLVLPDQRDVSSFSAAAEDFVARYLAEGIRREYGENARMTYGLQTLDGIHLKPELQGRLATSAPFSIYALSLIALFIVAIACINYMNLATAPYSRRAKEAGIRRTLGADRKSLALQFLAEALVLTLLALFISVGLAEFLLSLQPMVDFLGSPLDIDLDENSGQLLLLTIAGIFLGLLSGSYPAFYFSSIPPAEAFKPQSVAANRSSLPLRSSLLTLQMLLSITVLAGAFIMLTQVNYLEDRPLGFDKENKLAVKLGLSPDPSGIRPFMNQLREHPGITQVTMANLLPGTPGLEPEAMIERNNGENASFKLNWIRVDENYLPTMGIDLVAGNNFDATQLESGNPIQPFLVNQTLVDAMAWDMPIGKEIYLPGWNITGRVSGVFRDYHFLDLHQELALLLLSPIYPKDRFGRSIILNVLPGNLQEVLAFIDAKLQEFRPGPLVYSFIDQELSARYVTEQRQMKMVAGFSCVSILIACIGLLGLSAFTIEQRTKEIGIRKTLGASTLRIIAMLFKPVLGLIPSASLLAAGIAYLTMDEWLENFAYRVDISPLIFVAASGVVVLLAFLTMGSQAYRIARENPVNALRYE